MQMNEQDIKALKDGDLFYSIVNLHGEKFVKKINCLTPYGKHDQSFVTGTYSHDNEYYYFDSRGKVLFKKKKDAEMFLKPITPIAT